MTALLDREPELRQIRKRVFRFDRVLSLLLAILFLLAVAVAWLAILWLASQIWPTQAPPQSIELLQLRSGEEEGMAGDDPELGENALPSTDEMPLRDPSLQFDDNDVVEVLSSVLDSLAENEIDLSDPSQRDGETGSGRSGAAGGQGLEGTGSGRGGVPNHARWDIQFPSQSLTQYAQMLDALGIELGIVRRGEPVLYVSQLSKGKPVVRTSTEPDNRLSFRWQDAPRKQADLNLLRQKGLPVDNAFVVQFFPPSLENQLLQIEQQFANKPIEKIRKTRFGIRGADQDHQFYVIEQIDSR